MNLRTVWQGLRGTGQAADVAQAEAALQRLVTGRRQCEEAVQRLAGELATIDEQRAALEIQVLVEGESSDVPERRRVLLERQRAIADELDTKRRLLDHVAPAIATAEAALAEARVDAEQQEVRRLVGEYEALAGELRQRVADLAPLAEQLGRRWTAMEGRHQALAAASRELKRPGLMGLPDGVSLAEVVGVLREAHARGLRQAEPLPADPPPEPAEEVDGNNSPQPAEVDEPLAAESPLPVASFEDHGHVWTLGPLTAEAPCRPTADTACRHRAVFCGTYTMPGGKAKTWALCETHTADFAARHRLQVPA